MLGFTVTFRLLFGNIGEDCSLELDEEDAIVQSCNLAPYRNLLISILSTFELTLLSSYDGSIFRESDYQVLSIVVFMVAIIVVLVVVLNALIAVLADSYSRVQQNETANLRKERADLIVEYLILIPERKRKKLESNSQYFHALLEADDHGDLLVHHEDWQGGLNALKTKINDLHEFYGCQTLNSIEKVKK